MMGSQIPSSQSNDDIIEILNSTYANGDKTDAIFTVLDDNGDAHKVKVIAPNDSLVSNKKYFKITTPLGRRIVMVLENSTTVPQKSTTATNDISVVGVTKLPENKISQTSQVSISVSTPTEKNLGEEITQLIKSIWNKLLGTDIQPDAYIWLIITLVIGLIIGSVYRIGYCKISDLNGTYCNIITGILVCLAIFILAIISHTREKKDPNKDLYDYWQFYIMAISMIGIIITLIYYTIRTSGIKGSYDYVGGRVQPSYVSQY